MTQQIKNHDHLMGRCNTPPHLTRARKTGPGRCPRPSRCPRCTGRCPPAARPPACRDQRGLVLAMLLVLLIVVILVIVLRMEVIIVIVYVSCGRVFESVLLNL